MNKLECCHPKSISFQSWNLLVLAVFVSLISVTPEAQSQENPRNGKTQTKILPTDLNPPALQPGFRNDRGPQSRSKHLIDKFREPLPPPKDSTPNPEAVTSNNRHDQTVSQVDEKTTEDLLPEYLPRPSTIEQRLIKALDELTEVTFYENELTLALQHLEEIHGIQIWFDPDLAKFAEQEGTVTLKTSKMPLRSCLNLLLDKFCLTYLIEDDVLKITTKALADGKLLTRTYPVGDLFADPEDASEFSRVLNCGLGLTGDASSGSLVVTTKTRVVVARLSHRGHDQLVQLLRDLRKVSTSEVGHVAYNTNTKAKNTLVRLRAYVNLQFRYKLDERYQKVSDIPIVFLDHRGVVIALDNLESELNQEKRLLEALHGETILDETQVVITADPNLPADDVTRLIERCKKIGFRHFLFQRACEPRPPG